MKGLLKIKFYPALTGMIIISLGIMASAQDIKTDFKSKVPKYTFPETLKKQEKALENNPLLLRIEKSREKLSDDLLPLNWDKLFKNKMI